nr:ribosome-inactivating protein [Tanacetum cinerariifolium]
MANVVVKVPTLNPIFSFTKYDQNIFYYNNGYQPNITAYVNLLEQLRSRLASETDVYGIAVTRPPTNILLKERFVQVQLENSRGEVITVIIHTLNVYVVGYLVVRNNSQTLHFLDDYPKELFQAFPSTRYNYSGLGFAGNYNDLKYRLETQLGHGALNIAITNLFYTQSQSDQSKKRALLVIIQMVAEAVRIRYIEHLILRNMYANLNSIPDSSRAISLQNNWSALSNQIQWSECQFQVAVGADEPCPYGEPTTNIIGRDGQCVNVKENKYNNGDPIVLRACENAQRNQLWTFKSDGTIRSNGKCLTTDGNHIMIFDCDKAVPPQALNPSSGFFIMLWALYGDSTIRLYSDSTLCVTSDGHESLNSIILLNCKGSEDQRWTFMADGTILNPNARLVMDVRGSDVSLQEIILYQPTRNPNQKWLAF